MTSRQKMLRQRDQATSFLQAPVNPYDSPCYYVFVAGAGNIVGNYPINNIASTGYMLPARYINPPAGTIIRDMGKTIKAPILGRTTTPGFFRAIQLINPVPSVGATDSTTFGVGIGSQGTRTLPEAGNTGDFGYGTYYLPIIINGTIPTTSADFITFSLPVPYLPLGGQM